MHLKKIVLPVLLSIFSQTTSADELRPSYSYSPAFKTIYWLHDQLINRDIKDSPVLIYKGTDSTTQGDCYVIVHQSEDPAHPIHSAIIWAAEKIYISKSRMSTERIEAKATHVDYRSFIASGQQQGEVTGVSEHSTLFVNPKDIKSDGSFAGQWKYFGPPKEINGYESLDADEEAQTKTLSYFIVGSSSKAKIHFSFHFSSKTNKLLDASYTGQDQVYALTRNGKVIFSKIIAPEEGAIESSAICSDLREPRKPGVGNSMALIHTTGTDVQE